MMIQKEADYEALKSVLEELQILKAKEKEDMELMMSEKDSEKQVRQSSGGSVE